MGYLTGGLDAQDNAGATAPDVTLVGAGSIYALDANSDSIWVTPAASSYVLVSSITDPPSWALIVNANIDPAAAITYSKLSLTNSIVNADISTTAAIAYSKLNLAGQIVNADIATGAAIVVSKIAGGTATYILQTVGATATWVDPSTVFKRMATMVWNGRPYPGRGRTLVVPRKADDATVTVTLKRARARVEFAGTSGTTTILIQKSSGGNVEPSWTTIATLAIAAGDYEATDVTAALGTLTSGDLVSVYFSGVSANSEEYTVELQGNE